MMPWSTPKRPTTKALISAAASAAATVMVVRSVVRDFVPREVSKYIYFKLKTFFSSELTLVIEEYDNLNQNHLFNAAEIYLQPIIPPNTPRLKISMSKKEESNVSLSLERDQEINDSFKGVALTWKFFSNQSKLKFVPRKDQHGSIPIYENRYFELSFHKKHKNLVIDSYVNHVVEKSKELKEKNRTLKLHTLGSDKEFGRGNVWQAVNLDHPATFDTVAMDFEVKKMIMEDLDRFVRRKDFYRRVGKAWKRGYLLFGPPGTGKSSLIGAMANYLKFDIYDLELTDIRTNSDLRKLLINTANKSILVVEDIDCSIELQSRIKDAKASNSKSKTSNSKSTTSNDQETKVTLSGLLNFVDGLWSSCGDERVIIFTTNHIKKLDPALLRPGRMDLHVHMSYCSPCGFRTLASNYLGITTEHEHDPLMKEIEELLETTKVTPAEVGEQLMKSEDCGVALRGLVEFLELQKKEQDEVVKKESELAIEEAEAEAEKEAEVKEEDGPKEEMSRT